MQLTRNSTIPANYSTTSVEIPRERVGDRIVYIRRNNPTGQWYCKTDFTTIYAKENSAVYRRNCAWLILAAAKVKLEL